MATDKMATAGLCQPERPPVPSGAGGRLSSTFCLMPPSPRAPGLCSQGLGTCLSLVRRANKSSWPTSSSLTVSHFKIKIINTETYRG